MAVPIWQPGRLYLPGDVVRPVSAPPSSAGQIPNPDFSGSATDWVLAGGAAYSGEVGYTGAGVVRVQSSSGSATSTVRLPVRPGQSVTVSCMGRMPAGSDGTSFDCNIMWFDSGDNPIAPGVEGAEVRRFAGSGWRKSTVTGIAPPNAATFTVRGDANVAIGGQILLDNFVLESYSFQSTEGLVYRAVQPEAGTSGAGEPAWPPTAGQTVTDNEVTWEAIVATRVVWQASPILRSSGLEPDWPTNVRDFVADGSISWQAISRRVTDANCPNSKVVVILASKVFAADRDIVRFSATANPLDWTSEQDAGYLPTGLQQANANDMAVLNQYRSNLVAFNTSSFQNWQVDPDPAAMAILDQMDGIGSSWQQAAQPVGNELFYLAQLGVRTVGIAGASTNLQSGDVGMPIDPLVQAAIAAAVASGVQPRSTYYPSAGQYWLAFADYPEPGVTQTFVYSMTQTGKIGAWSRYVFPFSVEAFAQLGNDLYVRSGNAIRRVDETAVADEVDGEEVPFAGRVQWSWLDFGQPGVTKMLEGFDYVGTGQGPSISIGFDQRDPNAFTEPYAVSNDTLPGGIIPLPVAAPTMSVRMDYEGGEAWSLQSVLLSFFDMGNGP